MNDLRTPVELDLLEANAIVAALEQRVRTLRDHIEHGVQDDALDRAILQTLRAEDAIRKAFRLSERELDAQHDANMAALDALAEADVAFPDIPLALMALDYADRADEYRTRGA